MNQYSRHILLNPSFEKEEKFVMTDWICLLLFSILYMALWHPPGIPLPPLSLFLILALGGGVFVLQRKTLSGKGIDVFWMVTLTSLAGALLALTRSEHVSEAAWNSIGYMGNVIGFFLFLPLLSKRKARIYILYLHIFIALLWCLKIQELVSTYGVIRYWTFGFTGSNKNHIGICLALGSVASLYYAVFFSSLKLSNTRVIFTRVLFGIFGLAILFNLSLIYARSSMLSAILGVLFVLFIFFKQNKSSASGVLKLFLLLIIMSIAVIIALPKILSISTSWEQMISQPTLENAEGNTYDDRTTILRKGLYLVEKNPIIGVGIGGGRYRITDEETGQFFRTSLMHNTYLADWVDKGILGLVSLFIWIFSFAKFTIPRYMHVKDSDRIWLILFVMTFFSMLFKDLSSIGLTMFTLLVAIIYQRTREEKAYQQFILRSKN